MDPLVEHLVVLEIVEQRVGHAVGRGGHEHGGAGHAGGAGGGGFDEDRDRHGRLVHPVDHQLAARAQVVSKVKAIAPISSGNQPPSGTLMRFGGK